MQLTFWGAARQVTGSTYLLELADGFKILVDCGADFTRDAYNGKNPTVLYRGNSSILPFDPTEINLVILTHAHLDHSGHIPLLIREGYEGQVLCTPPTFDLCKLLLMDSARLHRRKYNSLVGTHKKQTKVPRELLNSLMAGMFLEHHVEESFDRFVTIQYKQRFKIKKGVHLTFIQTGHLLGAANVLLEIEEDGVWKKIGFSGDIGRYNYPLLQDPDPFPEVDYLICESTYGARYHDDEGDPADHLEKVIQETCVDRPGRLVIPAFSIGRTQAILYTLNRLYTERGFAPVKVFADSPLAVLSTRVYEKFHKYLNKDAVDFYEENEALFDFESLHIIESAKESNELKNHFEPCIIISSSGMISGGRVEQHVKNNIGNPYATILMIGYAADGTIGRELLDGAKVLKFNNLELPVAADIRRTDIFSGHGDLDDLVQFVQQQNPEKVKKVFLVHGDFPSMVSFQATLQMVGYQNVETPAKGEMFEL